MLADQSRRRNSYAKACLDNCRTLPLSCEMPKATVTTRGRITIPRDVRDALGIKAGDRVTFIAEGTGAYSVVAATRDVRRLKGLVSKPPCPVSVEEMKRAVVRSRKPAARTGS